MERTYIGELQSKVGEEALIKGWVSVRRDQGKMVFFDFRDMSGSVQGVVLPNSEAMEVAKEIRSEFVVAVCAADPVSIERFLASEPFVRQSAAGEPLILVNRLRKSVLGASAKTQITETLSRLANLSVHGFVPDDPAACDQALLEALPIALARRSSGVKQAIAMFTQNHILGQRSRLDKRVAKLG